MFIPTSFSTTNSQHGHSHEQCLQWQKMELPTKQKKNKLIFAKNFLIRHKVLHIFIHRLSIYTNDIRLIFQNYVDKFISCKLSLCM